MSKPEVTETNKYRYSLRSDHRVKQYWVQYFREKSTVSRREYPLMQGSVLGRHLYPTPSLLFSLDFGVWQRQTLMSDEDAWGSVSILFHSTGIEVSALCRPLKISQ